MEITTLKKEINDAWETILLNQFHDIIPGSSIKDVYDVTKVEYKELLDKVTQLIDKTIDSISDKINLKIKVLLYLIL